MLLTIRHHWNNEPYSAKHILTPMRNQCRSSLKGYRHMSTELTSSMKTYLDSIHVVMFSRSCLWQNYIKMSNFTFRFFPRFFAGFSFGRASVNFPSDAVLVLATVWRTLSSCLSGVFVGIIVKPGTGRRRQQKTGHKHLEQCGPNAEFKVARPISLNFRKLCKNQLKDKT